MTLSSNHNRARRRLPGERRRPRAASARPVLNQSSPDKAITLWATRPPQEPPPRAEAPTNTRAQEFRFAPSWIFAALALLLASAILVTSMVMWKAADDRRTLASDRAAAASAASVIIEKMLGYNYKSFDQHTREVSALLTGGFKKEFVQAATQVVKPLAVQNQAVIQAKVSEVSVMSTPGLADVKVLLFVDQSTTSAKLASPQIDQNRVILTMSQTDGRWLVSKVEAF